MSDQTVITNSYKPGKVQAIEIILLVSGIINILAGLGAACGFAASIIGIFCLPVVILPALLGAYEVYYASQLMSGKLVQASNIKTIAIFEIITIVYGNVPGLVAGILNLVFMEDLPVKDYIG